MITSCGLNIVKLISILSASAVKYCYNIDRGRLKTIL